MSLSTKQEAFITAYLKSFNATSAAIEAGYSENTAGSQGSRLLKNVEINAAIKAKMAEYAMTAEEVLYHLATIARGDIDAVTDDNGNLDKEKARIYGLTGLIKRTKYRSIVTGDSDIHEAEIEVYDRLKALELLAKYHDLINRSTVKIEDWRLQAIQDIRAGIVTYDALVEAFDGSLATELFAAAGVPISTE